VSSGHRGRHEPTAGALELAVVTAGTMDREVLENARVIWDYHRLGQPPRPCDVIVILCSNDLRVADHSVELVNRRWSPSVVYTGGLAHQGDLLATGWDRPEATVFAERALSRGLTLDPGAVLIEPEATNTGENFAFTARLLHARGISFRSALVVTKPFMERRAFATGRVAWPEVELVVTSPPTSFEDYLQGGALAAGDVVNLMVGDLQRIDRYGRCGFQLSQEIPPAVWTAFHRLVALGYDRHLLPEER
jgi:hypothetical protein